VAPTPPTQSAKDSGKQGLRPAIYSPRPSVLVRDLDVAIWAMGHHPYGYGILGVHTPNSPIDGYNRLTAADTHVGGRERAPCAELPRHTFPIFSFSYRSLDHARVG